MTTALITSACSPNMYIPWVEKYRPSEFKDIVLEPVNRQFFENLLNSGKFPNLLFYGPPGTGKTTTIISLINKFHGTTTNQNRGLVLHLNASDDRGIDVIRNQINQFVNSKTMFQHGMKFVILDEVDYMTKNAQQALRYLLQESYHINVRFCLICNYVSKIDDSLKNEFICIRFNQLPTEDIHNFLKNISIKENLNLCEPHIQSIQRRFQSDIRSMINFLQMNQCADADMDYFIIDENVFQQIESICLLKENDVKCFKKYIYELCVKYNQDKKEIIKHLFHYIIRTGAETGKLTTEMLDFMEETIHNDSDYEEYLDFVFYGLRSLSNTKSI